VDEFQAHNLQGGHEDVAEDEEVVYGGGGGVETVPRRFSAKEGSGGVDAAAAEAEEEEEGEEEQREPGGERDEDAVGEAGRWERGREVGAWSLRSVSLLCSIVEGGLQAKLERSVQSLQGVDCRTTSLFCSTISPSRSSLLGTIANQDPVMLQKGYAVQQKAEIVYRKRWTGPEKTLLLLLLNTMSSKDHRLNLTRGSHQLNRKSQSDMND
jgi:hypothetical protein